jgi:hypothetical protein
MTDGAKPKTSGRAPFDSAFERETSDVHSSGGDTGSQRLSGTYEAAGDAVRPSVRESMAERAARIEHKMNLAAMLLARLAPTDGRARLLSSAIHRRDEVLLDAVLESMVDAVVGLIPKDRTRST